MTSKPRTAARVAAAAAVLVLAGTAACDFDPVSGNGSDNGEGVFYGLGDDHKLYRWDTEADPEEALDLSGVWEGLGDVGTVMRSSLSISPTERYAAWISGANPDASLEFGNLQTGAITTGVEYPLDHACLDPSWLADGSALLVHRAPVWGESLTQGEIPLPVKTWGPTEWYSPDVGALPTTVDLGEEGCRLRWYTNEEGEAEGIYHDLDVQKLFRVNTTGGTEEIILVSSLHGTEPRTIGMFDIDPTGRYVCLVDSYGPYGALKGGFTMRAESGTRVIDLNTGNAVEADDASCVSMHEKGFISRDGAEVAFIDYNGKTRWEDELPDTIAESPVLFYFPPKD